MKNFIYLGFFFLVFLSGCSWQSPIHSSGMQDMPCHQMGGQWMGKCEFDENGNVIVPKPQNTSFSNAFSTDTTGLPLVKPSEKIMLKHGDSYTMTAEMVAQDVGEKTIARLAYNQQIPGPEIMVEQGSTVFITLVNKTSIPTTLHPHGLRLDDAFDGVPKEMMGMQDPIKPGQSFTYTLTFPDAGMFWYHPHIREDYTQEMGMYGVFLVKPKSSNYWNPVDREEILIVDDFAKSTPFFTDHTDHTLMGRYGDVFLLNNQVNPQFTAKRGEKIRFYILNTANVRPFDLAIDGGQMVLVGGDSGRIETEQKITHFVLAPGERAIIEMQFEDDGVYPITNRGKQIASIKVLSEDIHSVSVPVLRDNADDYNLVQANFSDWLKKSADKSLTFTMQMDGMGNMAGMNHRNNSNDDGIEWDDAMYGMNSMSTDKNTKWILQEDATGKENMDIHWSFAKGSLVKISLYNDPNSMHPMQHPFHMHGQRFVVLSTDGVANENLQWKDTVLVPAGKKIDILLDASNMGSWMAHCHISEHLHAGMMLHFDVE